MNKILKILISILIAISMILNPLTFTASAVDPATITFIIAQIVKYAAEGFVVGITTYAACEGAQAAHDAEQVAITQAELAAAHASGGGGYEITAVSAPGNDSVFFLSASYSDDYNNLSDDEKEFADFLVNYINSSDKGYIGEYNFTLDPTTPNVTFSANCYDELKTDVSNAYYEWATKKVAMETQNETILELAEAGNFPVYSFDFVGPLPSMTVPTSEGMADLSVDGFRLTVPTSSMVVRELNGNLTYFFTSEEAARAAGCTSVSKMFTDDNGLEYWSGSINATAYGGGNYILYDGVVYYFKGSYYGSQRNFSISLEVNQSQFSRFVSLDGVALSDVYSGGTISVGAVFNTTNEVQAPVPSKSISESDFITSVGGSVEIPRTDEEEIIGNGIELGLINPDSTITFDESGNITAVDDIEIAKLEELIEKISAGNLELEDIQSYLDLITKLVSSGNMTATEQMIILDNIKSLEQAQADDLAAIRSAITSMTATDSVVDTGFNIETPATIIDKFPFSLPFDVYTVFNLLSAEPETPVFIIPFEMEGIFDFSIEIDLSDFNFIAEIVRWFLYIIFIIGLILITNNLIGRG